MKPDPLKKSIEEVLDDFRAFELGRLEATAQLLEIIEGEKIKARVDELLRYAEREEDSERTYFNDRYKTLKGNGK